MIDIGSPQFLFMAEAEGMTNLVNTRTAKINAVIKTLRDRYYHQVITQNEIFEVLKDYELVSISEKELNFIISELRKA